MLAARTTLRRVAAFAGRVCVAASFLLTGVLGCGGNREYAPDPNDRGVWRFGSAPADLTIVVSATTGASSSASSAPAATKPEAPPSVPGDSAGSPSGAPAGSSPTAPSPSSPPPKSSGPSGPYKVIDVKDGGSIHVICRVVDVPAELETVVAFKDRETGCTDHKTERCRFVRKGAGDLRLGGSRVYLRSIREGKDWPEALRGDDRTYVIDQKACVYLPHIGWTRPSTQVVVSNSDRAEHNIHGNFGSDSKFNFGSEPGTRKNDIAEAFLETPGMYVVTCNIHPWMNAYIHLSTHPYVAITPETDGDGGSAGEVTLDDVPPGTYELVCWHEGMVSRIMEANGKPSLWIFSPDQEAAQAVTVTAKARSEVVFTIPYK